MKVYLAGGISDKDRFEGQIRTVRLLRQRGVEDIYAAALNDSINDKSNDPEPIDIYNGDIDRVKESDIFIVRLSGGNEIGTISEIGMVAGWNEMVEAHNKQIKECYDPIMVSSMGLRKLKPIKIIAYTTNLRLVQPQFYQGMASAGVNHLVLGMIDRWGTFVGDEDDMLKYVKEMVENEVY